MLSTLFTGAILGKLFANLAGFVTGTLFGGIVGFMLGRGVNPLKWITDKFSNKSSEK